MLKNVEKLALEISQIINDDMYHLLDEDDCKYLAEHLIDADYRKQSEGEWVEKNVFFAIYKCSICGEENLYKDGHACLSKFCPNCGAKMGGGAE